MKKIIVTILVLVVVITGLSFVKFFSKTVTSFDCSFGECYPKEMIKKVDFWQYTFGRDINFGND